MTDLSPAAQAIVNAAVEAGGGYGRSTPVLHARLAAALRAAADCLWVDKPDGANGVYETHRAQLLAIADELETQ